MRLPGPPAGLLMRAEQPWGDVRLVVPGRLPTACSPPPPACWTRFWRTDAVKATTGCACAECGGGWTGRMGRGFTCQGASRLPPPPAGSRCQCHCYAAAALFPSCTALYCRSWGEVARVFLEGEGGGAGVAEHVGRDGRRHVCDRASATWLAGWVAFLGTCGSAALQWAAA